MTFRVTDNQQLILDAVFWLKKNRDKWPTYRELASHTGFQVSYVHASVRSLVKKSKMTVIAGKHRGMRGKR